MRGHSAGQRSFRDEPLALTSSHRAISLTLRTLLNERRSCANPTDQSKHGAGKQQCLSPSVLASFKLFNLKETKKKHSF